MAELTQDASLRGLGEQHTEQFPCDSLAAQTFYKGAGVIIDASVDTVNMHTADSITCVDGDVFMGIAANKKVVAAGASETDVNSLIEIIVGPSIVGFKSTVFTRADLGKTVYMSDTGTLTASNGAYPQIGKLHDVRDGYAFVELVTPFVLNVP